MRITAKYFGAALAPLTIAAGLFAACNGSQSATASQTTGSTTPSTAVLSFEQSIVRSITYQQGGCFGTCPVYTLAVAPDGGARYDGLRFAPYKGAHLGSVPRDTLILLYRLAEAVLAKADELPREIDTGIQDHSYSAVTVATATDTIEFVGTTDYAPPVDTLRKSLMRIHDYVEFERDPAAPPAPKNELLVRLKSADQIQVVQEEFYRQQFKVVAFEDKATTTFRVRFDPYTMSAEEMVRVLESRPEVVSARIAE